MAKCTNSFLCTNLLLLSFLGLHEWRLRRPPGRVRGQVGLETVRVRVVAVQHGHQVTNVRRGQPERFNFRQFGVGRHVGYAVPEVGERVVDALRPSPFLLVGRVPALDDAHNRHRRRHKSSRSRLRRTAMLLHQMLLLLQQLLSPLKLQLLLLLRLKLQSFIVVIIVVCFFVVVVVIVVVVDSGGIVVALLCWTVLQKEPAQ